MMNFTLCILKEVRVLAPSTGEHYKQRLESSETRREARSRHIIANWEDANMTVILKIIHVRFRRNTQNPEPIFLSHVAAHLHISP